MNKLIEEILKGTFDRLRKLYDSKDEQKYVSAQTSSRLVFPTYREKGIRVSEQELRFMFIDEFNRYCNENNINDVFYSVETPTKDKYTFSHKGEEISPKVGNGKSGNFDLTLLDANKSRLCLIEFKAGNVSKQSFEEVLVKLANPVEDGKLRYIIHMVENTRSEECTGSILEAVKWLHEESGLKKVVNLGYVFESLTDKTKSECVSVKEIYDKFCYNY